MEDSQNLPSKSHQSIQIFNDKKLVASVTVAFSRLGLEDLSKLGTILTDVKNEFATVPEDVIIKGIKNGSLGKFGRTYRMCSQEVCYWIRETIKENTKNEEDYEVQRAVRDGLENEGLLDPE